MTTDEELQRVQVAKMSDTELVKLTTPYHNQLKEQGEMRDNDTIDDKQLKVAQTPIVNAAAAVVKLRLKKEEYRAVWDYKDTRRADKWAHKDAVAAMKKERKEKVAAAKAAVKAEKAAKKAADAAAKKAKSDAARENKRAGSKCRRGKSHTRE